MHIALYVHILLDWLKYGRQTLSNISSNILKYYDSKNN